MRFIDTYDDILHYFPSSEFKIHDWIDYAERISPHLYRKVKKSISEYDFEKEVLPVVTTALQSKEKMSLVHMTFQSMIKKLKAGFTANFGTDLDVDVILYLGLYNVPVKQDR